LRRRAAAGRVWDPVLAAVRRWEGLPGGLGARDTLRLEAGLPLCGTDMDADTTPLEAGIAWVVKLRKPRFIGREVLARQAAAGPERRLVGFRLDEPGVPRHGQTVWQDGAHLGTVTSGTKSPTLGTFIGIASVAAPATRTGTAVGGEIPGPRLSAPVLD